jgi:outer membrane protein OmpA-like peptidoglycan-associated protein
MPEHFLGSLAQRVGHVLPKNLVIKDFPSLPKDFRLEPAVLQKGMRGQWPCVSVTFLPELRAIPNRRSCMKQRILLLLSGAALLSGCATKNYVHENVEPLQNKLDQVAQQVSQQGTELQQTQQDVEKNKTAISAVDEKATAADHRATDAINGVKQTQQEINLLRGVIANFDAYRVTGQVTILFPVNSANLHNEDKYQLDQLAANTNSLKRYFIAVAGFTDQTGSADYNLALSKRRADAVVQYLAVQRKVPFYQMRTIGLGEQELVDDGASREARALSRRVEVRIYSVDESKLTAASPN